MNFKSLVQAIYDTHGHFQAQAFRAVNISLTLRNWVIGYYISTYELEGSDRAAYGERLLELLAQRLQHEGFERADARELRRYRQFCLTYPQIRDTLSPDLRKSLPNTSLSEKRETLSPGSPYTSELLLSRLSFSHFSELITIDDRENELTTKPRAYGAPGRSGSFGVRFPRFCLNVPASRPIRPRLPTWCDRQPKPTRQHWPSVTRMFSSFWGSSPGRLWANPIWRTS